jgi:signal peptidase I
MSDELVKPEVKASSGRPWAGVIFSLFLPGFGIARAGLLGRGLAWFVGIELSVVAVGVLFALETIPFGLGVTAAACLIVADLVMLYQSYRPGRMTAKHWAAFLVISVLSMVLPSPTKLVVHPFEMPTGSMIPTIQGGSGKGDHVFVDRLTYRFSSPRRGDLLVFLTKGLPELRQDQFYIKRIVGMPGERLQIHDGSVFANGTRLGEKDNIPPIHFVTREEVEHRGEGSGGPYQVPEGTYFVLGDNSTNSLDSRFFGCVPRENVYGKVTAIYFPFSRAGRPRYPGQQ